MSRWDSGDLTEGVADVEPVPPRPLVVGLRLVPGGPVPAPRTADPELQRRRRRGGEREELQESAEEPPARSSLHGGAPIAGAGRKKKMKMVTKKVSRSWRRRNEVGR